MRDNLDYEAQHICDDAEPGELWLGAIFCVLFLCSAVAACALYQAVIR